MFETFHTFKVRVILTNGPPGAPAVKPVGEEPRQDPGCVTENLAVEGNPRSRPVTQLTVKRAKVMEKSFTMEGS